MKNNKVLIIEDDRFLSRQLASYFTNKSYEVVGQATTAAEAVTLAREHMPDLLMVDIELDGKQNGIEACEQIGKFLDSPIIYLSQFRSKKWERRIRDTRPKYFLSKPFNEHELEMNLRIMEEHSRQSDLAPMRNYVFIKDKDIHIRVAVKEILFLEAARSSCNIVMIDNKITVSNSMKAVMHRLNHPYVVKISRSYAINVEQVTGFGGGKIYINQHSFTVTSDYKENVMKKLEAL